MNPETRYGGHKAYTDEFRPRKRRRWIGVVMTNNTLHVKEYSGPLNFKRSLDHDRFARSKRVRTVVGPFSINTSVDPTPIVRKKAERAGPLVYRRGGRFDS